MNAELCPKISSNSISTNSHDIKIVYHYWDCAVKKSDDIFGSVLKYKRHEFDSCSTDYPSWLLCAFFSEGLWLVLLSGPAIIKIFMDNRPIPGLISLTWMSTWRTGTGLAGSYPGRLDIYSDSDITSFDGIVIDADLGYKVFSNKKGWLAAVAGYLYQDFEYNTALIRQWSPSGLEGFDYVGDGSTSLEYKMYYKIPYFFE